MAVPVNAQCVPGIEAVPVVGCLGVPISGHTRESAAQGVVRLAREIRAARHADDVRRADGTKHTDGTARADDAGHTDGARAGATARGDVHLCNAYTLTLAERDPELLETLGSAALNLPDGQPVVWANRLLHRGTALPSRRVYGPDLLLDVFALSTDTELSHYLLGSTPRVLKSLERELRSRYPGARIAGTCSPPFRPLTDRELRQQAEEIRSVDADIVWVGLGTPKQDRWSAELCELLPVVAVAVGAAFDFVAGTKPQAPSWMQRSGLEWVFRFGCEPRRLWRRYLFGNARFVRGVVRQATRRGQAHGPAVPTGSRSPESGPTRRPGTGDSRPGS
ncbi:WecB/TagA/CpsF family glycosyltransferase [Streptomyces tirandamycinicus]|uniref:WecB/TagA/CpsF family glycosyltransferase n=1 Tax=Streptomyces tirandamycinicus TaxID=2174846 RepID=UPI00341D4BEB